MHMDHFIGFDTLLRVHVGREKVIRVAGPEEIIDRAGHKLKGYDWDLVERYDTDLVFEVVEVGARGPEKAARFRFKRRFERESIDPPRTIEAAGLAVETALLEHHGPCLGFAVAEPQHVNVWKSRLDARGFRTGQWLQALKAAVVAGASDDQPIRIGDGDVRPFGELRDLVSVSRGQKIAYVTDVADTPPNREEIARLAHEADLLFIEARFAAADAGQARRRAHLTTTAAGEIARAAGVRRLEPFHFSPRYEGEEEKLLAEVFAALEPREEAVASL
jgi:ribonuclease Z